MFFYKKNFQKKLKLGDVEGFRKVPPRTSVGDPTLILYCLVTQW